MRRHLSTIAERDDWRCWVCGGDVDPGAGGGSPWAPTIDHVLPKAHGGPDDAANLRLAHRRCNGARGSRVPELTWPADLAVQHPVALLAALQRRQRRPGEWEAVGALLDQERATAAAGWLTTRAELLLGGRWSTRLVPAGGLLRLDVRTAPDQAPAPRPRPAPALSDRPRARRKGRRG